jgi:hypothetical protein
MQQHVQFACTMYVQKVLSFGDVNVDFSHIKIGQNCCFERYVWFFMFDFPYIIS